MYAVVETCGQQLKVAAGDTLKVEKLDGEVGAQVTFDKVLMVKTDDDVVLGNPYVGGAKVLAEILEHDRHKKIIVFKYKRRKDYRRNKGHRQPYTKIRIDRIELS